MKTQDVLKLMRETPWTFLPAEEGTNPDHVFMQTWHLKPGGQPVTVPGKVVVTELSSGWTDEDTYDYTLTDRCLAKVLRENPGKLLVVQVHLDAPLFWLRRYPREACVYFGGPENETELRAVMDTDAFDITGGGEEKEQKAEQVIVSAFWSGSKVADDAGKRSRRFVTGQSFSSKAWLTAASEALRRFVAHVEQSDGASRVIAYMPVMGCNGENLWWGSLSAPGDLEAGDYGLAHREALIAWALRKYGSETAVRSAWKVENLSAEGLRLPSAMNRLSYLSDTETGKLTDICEDYMPPLRTPEEIALTNDRLQADCNEFCSVACFGALETFGRIIKEQTGKVTGTFYGYSRMPNAAYAGQLAVNEALASPWFDFYTAPKAYHYHLAGEPGASQAPGQSFARKKLFIEENDLHTWLAGNASAPKNEAETRTCFWRELYRSLTFGYGFCRADPDSPETDWSENEILKPMLKQQADFYQRWAPVPRRSVAEVLLVTDEASPAATVRMLGLEMGLEMRLERELRHCGAPVDNCRLTDLKDMDLSPYKMVVFTRAFTLGASEWEEIAARLRPDVHVLWQYAAALLPGGPECENQYRVTGFRTELCPGCMHHADLYRHVHWYIPRPVPRDYPDLVICPEAGQRVLRTSPEGHVLTAQVKRGEQVSTLAVDLTLRTPLLRTLLEEAGVRFPAPQYCTVLADDRLLGFFPRYDMRFETSFEGDWRNVLTGEKVTGIVCLSIREKDFAVFEKM